MSHSADSLHMTNAIFAQPQSVLNAAARVIYSAQRCDHVTPLLRDLHWLKMRQWIDYKLAVLVFRCVSGLVPS